VRQSPAWHINLLPNRPGEREPDAEWERTRKRWRKKDAGRKGDDRGDGWEGDAESMEEQRNGT